MRKEDLQDAFQLLPDDLVMEGLEERPDVVQRNRRRTMTRWISSMAACLVLAVGSILFANEIGDRSKSSYPEKDTATNTSMQFDQPGKTANNEMPTDAVIALPSDGINAPGDVPKEGESPVVDFAEEGEMMLADFSMRASALALSEAAATDRNLLFCPEGFYNCLAMASAGADDDFREELVRIMGASSTQDLVDLMALRTGRGFRTDDSVLRLGTSVWVDDSLGAVREDYIRTIRQWNGEVYHGQMASAEMRQQILDWVARETEGRSTFEPDPRSLLTFLSTVYYADLWEEPFKAEGIVTDSFVRADGQKVQTSFMTDMVWNSVAWEGEDYFRTVRAFQNGEMFFVLPKEGTDLTALCENPEVLEDVVFGGDMFQASVRWQIPRFIMDAETDYTELAIKLGMSKLITAESSFTSIAEGAVGLAGDLSQHCYLRIDEKGVEAAGSTRMEESAAHTFVQMTLTRPFLYGILDNQGRIIFVGICNDPTVTK
ncbi:MAG: hypothetical protein IJM90_06895 [Firmicutes bacterium]|nr:hypothetical protein [Bacillota bacterium]